MTRFDFMDCPMCAGHEKIGADTGKALERMLAAELDTGDHPYHIRTELMNIRNAIINRREPRIAPIVAVDEDPLLA